MWKRRKGGLGTERARGLESDVAVRTDIGQNRSFSFREQVIAYLPLDGIDIG